MNMTEMRVIFDEWNLKYHTTLQQFEEGKKIENKRRELQHLASESDSLVEYLTLLLRDLKVLKQVVRQEEVAFKKRRLGYIDGSITEKLNYIFPEKKLIARTDCNFERKNTKLQLTLIDCNGNIRPPYLTEGKFAQQLISYAASESCTKILGKNILYLDESFSNASEDNLLKTQELLKNSAKAGFQIILISQSPLLFVDIEHREIHLKSDDGQYINFVEYNDFLGGIE